jgi:hypothetical protein
MSTWLVVLIIVIAVIVLLLGAFAGMQMRRRQLRQRFGPEYDRLVAERDGRVAAEKELRDRERRHAELELRPLSDEARNRYLTEWEEIQARFLDAPDEAVRAGDDLVDRVVAERGYPAKDFDERLADLSVEHAYTVGHYRDARDIAQRNARGEASTEELRQALVHYRALFADLIGERSLAEGRTGFGEPSHDGDRRRDDAGGRTGVGEPSYDGDRGRPGVEDRTSFGDPSHDGDRGREDVRQPETEQAADAVDRQQRESTDARSGGRHETNQR